MRMDISNYLYVETSELLAGTIELVANEEYTIYLDTNEQNKLLAFIAETRRTDE